MRLLLAERGDALLHGPGGDGVACMWEACRHGYADVVAALLAAGGEAWMDGAMGGRRVSCLGEACQYGYAEVVTTLLGSLGPRLLRLTPTEAGDCLRLACDGGHGEIIGALVEGMDAGLRAGLREERRAYRVAVRRRGAVLARRRGLGWGLAGWESMKEALLEEFQAAGEERERGERERGGD